MRFFLLLSVLALVVVMTAASLNIGLRGTGPIVHPMVGAWEKLDVHSPDLIPIVQYIQTQYHSNRDLKFEVISANRKVVAGLLYDVQVKFYSPNFCQTDKVTVSDRFGTLSIFADPTFESCRPQQ